MNYIDYIKRNLNAGVRGKWGNLKQDQIDMFNYLLHLVESSDTYIRKLYQENEQLKQLVDKNNIELIKKNNKELLGRIDKAVGFIQNKSVLSCTGLDLILCDNEIEELFGILK